MMKKCETCQKYKNELDKMIMRYNSAFDVAIEMNEFIKKCECAENNSKKIDTNT